jgi:hypothetical protein
VVDSVHGFDLGTLVKRTLFGERPVSKGKIAYFTLQGGGVSGAEGWAGNEVFYDDKHASRMRF